MVSHVTDDCETIQRQIVKAEPLAETATMVTLVLCQLDQRVCCYIPCGEEKEEVIKFRAF